MLRATRTSLMLPASPTVMVLVATPMPDVLQQVPEVESGIATLVVLV